MAATTPDEQKARQIIVDVFREQPLSCVRFTTGLRHWVYDVVLQSGRKAVVRLSHPDHRADLAGGLFWHRQLEHVGVRVASVLAADLVAPQPFMVLERLPGTDLGNVFDELHDTQLSLISSTVVDMQRRTSLLPRGSGFGYGLNYEAVLQPSWRAVLDASIERSDRRIREAAVVDTRWVTRVKNRLEDAATLVDDVTPTAFLHDATTKNVIISNGAVSGLVDVDEMGFGDPLWTTGLTKMSLLSAGRSTTYADKQAELLGSSNSDQTNERLDLYTAIHCLGFLAELGQQFNQAELAAVDADHQRHLEAIMTSLL